ncbi:hypothetical protein [Bradyrhizobium lablabi]|uniref:Uncharacterized protein n=1 Tax=Bradyrhizobium lablabi TaxID=722472 RepID=A0A1H5LSG0_9BRAD|nr:hypothetical protein [Bradyrhizobium lablabi]SEE52541.1 hypothetical protein SAMN05444171_7855 [Bradyrhizobium lablabi]SEE79331.1 hypothetical protein SAMN05444171_8083 [Bradyrhizobium lablabi]
MRKPDPVEIVAVTIPVLIEAVCVTVFIGCAALAVIILATPVPA